MKTKLRDKKFLRQTVRKFINEELAEVIYDNDLAYEQRVAEDSAMDPDWYYDEWLDSLSDDDFDMDEQPDEDKSFYERDAEHDNYYDSPWCEPWY